MSAAYRGRSAIRAALPAPPPGREWVVEASGDEVVVALSPTPLEVSVGVEVCGLPHSPALDPGLEPDHVDLVGRIRVGRDPDGIHRAASQAAHLGLSFLVMES